MYLGSGTQADYERNRGVQAIQVFGLKYLGLVPGLTTSDSGFQVACVSWHKYLGLGTQADNEYLGIWA